MAFPRFQFGARKTLYPYSYASDMDSYTFVKPEEYFECVDSGQFVFPKRASFEASDNTEKSPFKTGAIVRLDGAAFLLLQFVRPKVWKIKFDPKVTAATEYNDFNSRVMMADTTANLRSYCDNVEGIFWETEFDQGSSEAGYYVLKSIQYESAEDLIAHQNGTIVTELRIWRDPFKLQAIRLVQESGTLDAENIDPPAKRRKIIWETRASGLGWKKCGKANSVLLTTVKPGASRYLGFGEQGGKTLFKEPALMNYFNFDNMTYSSVYNQGPLDQREPLYHSEPFWLEVNALPNYESQVATFIDNYSQICVDFCKSNAGQVRVGTRFGCFQAYIFGGNDVPEIISLYSSIIGRARLKPRYVLGHHQGCYGYDTRQKVLRIAHMYHNRDFPLDGIHIDVDMQDNYRTFTIDSKKKFPDPKGMFDELRSLGVKACTNITPIINCTPDAEYDTLNTGLAEKRFLLDNRFDDGNGVTPVHEVEYVCYEGGTKLLIDPVKERCGFETAATHYDFVANYNSGKEYRGGVGYGGALGAPGYYIDLNKQDNREWWGKQYTYLMEQGLEFVWQDMTTPAIAREYGDMKGLPFKLLVSSDPWPGEAPEDTQKPAIDLWALYSYNLHKATYEGLNNLPSRANKRNLIIGRGSYAGMHKYAGFWTGDNASNWDHFRISVAQVLSLGLSGMEIAGADVGGFMPGDWNAPRYAQPELLIRWYCAYSLLPWFRNHYHGKRGMKLFQEPWAYTDYYFSNPLAIPEKEKLIWLAVEPVCRYFVKLRYSLMQLMYDAMFEHQYNGLPIARALIITDTKDQSLYVENDWVLDNEYIVRRDLLVAPVMHSLAESGGHRTVYLPQPCSWYPFNLRINPKAYGVPLGERIEGGSTFCVDAHITSNEAVLQNITPMFVREGAIIPQIEPRQFIGDRSKINPITMNIYPGRDNSYNLILDDGVSRDSAPMRGVQLSPSHIWKEDYKNTDLDPEAKGKYNEVVFTQTTDLACSTRKLNIMTLRDGYGIDAVKADIGDAYTIVFWHDPSTVVTIDSPKVDLEGGGLWITSRNMPALKATVVQIPVDIPRNVTASIMLRF